MTAAILPFTTPELDLAEANSLYARAGALDLQAAMASAFDPALADVYRAMAAARREKAKQLSRRALEMQLRASVRTKS